MGVLEADKIMMDYMKSKVRRVYYRRTRKYLEMSLNGGITLKAMNAWTVALVS